MCSVANKDIHVLILMYAVVISYMPSSPSREFKGDFELFMGWDTYNFPKEMDRQGVREKGGKEGGKERGGERRKERGGRE